MATKSVTNSENWVETDDRNGRRKTTNASMTTKLVRHQRIVTLRQYALNGATLQQLKAICKKMGVSDSTVDSYIDEVVKDIQKHVK